jgi:hypothetical protein
MPRYLQLITAAGGAAEQESISLAGRHRGSYCSGLDISRVLGVDDKWPVGCISLFCNEATILAADVRCDLRHKITIQLKA